MQGAARSGSSIRMGRRGKVIEDGVLVDQILSGDKHAFRHLTEKYANYIYRSAFGVLRNASDAEDVAQEALAQIFLSLPKYEGKGLKSWVARITVNKAIDYKRKAYRKREFPFAEQPGAVLEQMIDETAMTEQRVLRQERRLQVREMIAIMPDNYRMVVSAYYLENKSYQQIAAELQMQVKSVESRMYRARQWVKKRWKEDGWP